jgi:ADP-dependent phosphofructokinase/glucokinase
MQPIKTLPKYIINSIINELKFIGFNTTEIRTVLNLTTNELSDLIQYDIMETVVY